MISFEINQQVGRKISRSKLKQWLKRIEQTLKIKKHLEISLAIVSDAAIKKLNRTYRGKNQTTDVLSFGEVDSTVKISQSVKNYLGEIIICYPQASRQAKTNGHSLEKELQLLLTHGFLHLLGHDHQKAKEAKIMREFEQKILGGHV